MGLLGLMHLHDMRPSELTNLVTKLDLNRGMINVEAVEQVGIDTPRPRPLNAHALARKPFGGHRPPCVGRKLF